MTTALLPNGLFLVYLNVWIGYFLIYFISFGLDFVSFLKMNVPSIKALQLIQLGQNNILNTTNCLIVHWNYFILSWFTNKIEWVPIEFANTHFATFWKVFMDFVT